MKTLRLRRPSAALVISTVALIVALGGTSYAAFTLPKNSVGTKQIRKSAVTGKKIAKNAVTSVKVKDGSLLAVDFKAGQLPAGPRGPKGNPGPQGPAGISGLQTVSSSPVDLSSNAQNGTAANCPAGKEAISGGWDSSGGTFEVRRSEPTASNAGWQVIVDNNSIETSLTVFAVCAKVG
jgi:hypothetical protein